MTNWKDKLPLAKKKKTSSAYMIRPNKRVNDWLIVQSEKHRGVSINKIIVAILEATIEREDDDLH